MERIEPSTRPAKRQTRLGSAESGVLQLMRLNVRQNCQEERVRARLAMTIVVFVGFALSACSPGPSTYFSVSQSELRSHDATTQAHAALKSYFNALGSRDEAAVTELTAPNRRPVGTSVRRIVVETITPEPSDSWTIDGVDSDADTRVFRAPVRMWPGDGSFQAGERLDWVWILERGSDGKWRVKDWGFI